MWTSYGTFFTVLLKNLGLPKKKKRKKRVCMYICITHFYLKIMKPLSYERNNMIMLVHETSVILLLLLEVSVPSQGSELSCIMGPMCVRGIYFESVSSIFLLNFWTVLTLCYFLCSIIVYDLFESGILLGFLYMYCVLRVGLLSQCGDVFCSIKRLFIWFHFPECFARNETLSRQTVTYYTKPKSTNVCLPGEQFALSFD